MITETALETGLAITNVLNRYYPHCQFKLTIETENKSTNILFESYSTESFVAPYPPDFNPFNEKYRNEKDDFWLNWSNTKKELSLGGWWRNEILSVFYARPSYSWIGEQGNTIPKPYPDGDKFQMMASSFYPIMLKYFSL